MIRTAAIATLAPGRRPVMTRAGEPPESQGDASRNRRLAVDAR